MNKIKSLSLATCVSLSGCVMVPVNDDGQVVWQPVPAPLAPLVVASAPQPVRMSARLYPTNETAVRSGMLSGSVTNYRNGKGRFELHYKGETLVGEATRSASDERGGVASAASAQGTYMNCTYRMNSPQQGAGTCTFSDGAQYQVHLGG